VWWKTRELNPHHGQEILHLIVHQKLLYLKPGLIKFRLHYTLLNHGQQLILRWKKGSKQIMTCILHFPRQITWNKPLQLGHHLLDSKLAFRHPDQSRSCINLLRCCHILRYKKETQPLNSIAARSILQFHSPELWTTRLHVIKTVRNLTMHQIMARLLHALLFCNESSMKLCHHPLYD
jgi:hypothetical protein